MSLLQKLDPATPAKWGVMNVHQMIEHFCDAVMNASGKLPLPVVYEGETRQKFREFVLSEKPFLPNTKNPLMQETPRPQKCHTVQAAIGKLHEELLNFFSVFDKDPGLVTLNPFFGSFNFEENVHLLYKHSLHHLKQFGVEPLT